MVRGVSVSLWMVYRERPWLAVVARTCTLLWNYLSSHPEISLPPPRRPTYPDARLQFFLEKRLLFSVAPFARYHFATSHALNSWVEVLSHVMAWGASWLWDISRQPKARIFMGHEKHRWREYRKYYCQFLKFTALAKFLHWEDQDVGGWTILKWILER
jgi:hypothetical protein